MNIALCFCVRNCEKYLHKIFNNIELIKSLKHNFYLIFIYDNCQDNTPNILQQYKKNNPNNNIIIRSEKNNSQYRTIRIAKARNLCLSIIFNELKNIDYHIMIDADNACTKRWNIDIIDKYLNNFDNDDWDCISFNRSFYYDIWALLFDEFKHHCFGFGNQNKDVLKIMYENIVNKLNNSNTNSISVLSAFNGFAIYKTNKFINLKYDGLYLNFKPLISDIERENLENILKNKYNISTKCLHNTIECCEHLFYHLNANKIGCKIKISKFCIM
jgi:hypothetical protein